MNAPSDPGAAPETKALLNYFYSISGLRTLSGQHSMYWDWENNGEILPVKQDQHVFNTVGKFPAVYGTDFGDGQDLFQRQRTIELIKQQAATGRIITVSYHFPGTRGDLAGVIDPTNMTVRPPFMDRIEELVTLFRMLDVDGARVPVIFRPLHEMNAPWDMIWWGKDGAANLQQLWKEIWGRFHNRTVPGENIHNVLWMFSVNAWLDSGNIVDPPDAYYPGHNYVDMLGVDTYIEAGYTWQLKYHEDLQKLGAKRPIAITESGCLPSFPTLRATQPNWVYWLTWRDRYDTTPADGQFPDNTLARYQTVASDPAVVWRNPDIYVRDFETDNGLTIPSPEYVDDSTGARHWWYESVDIKVDASPMSPMDLTDPVVFEAFLGDAPLRNAINRIYVRVHNRGPGIAINVKVKCLWTDASAGIPMLPADYWQYFPEPWMAPSAWKPVDVGNPYVIIDSIPPRSSRIKQIDWSVPPTAAEHTCMLVMVTGIGDPLIGSAATGVRSEKRVALRNLHVIDINTNQAFAPITLTLHPTSSIPRPGELAIDSYELPGGRVIVTVAQPAGRTLRLLNGKATSFRRIDNETIEHNLKRFELDVPQGLRKALSVEHLPRISGIELTPDRPTTIEIEWSLPEDRLEPGSTYRLRVLQFEDEAIQGGSTFVFRIPNLTPTY